MILLAAVLTLLTGLGVLWANPRRFINQVFTLFAAAATFWLVCVCLATGAGSSAGGGNAVWMKAAAVVGGFIPWILWLLKEAIVSPENEKRRTLRRSLLWLIAGLSLAVLFFAKSSLLLASPTVQNSQRDLAYVVYSFIILSIYLVIIGQAYGQMRQARGIRRLEMQFLTLNGGTGCVIILVTTSLGRYLNQPFLLNFTPVIILSFCALTAWAVIFHRVFDARQVFISLGQRTALILLLCLGIYGLWQINRGFLRSPADFIVSVAICSVGAFWLDAKSRGWLQLSAERRLAVIRQLISERARNEPNPERLIAEFQRILCQWAGSGQAVLLFDSGEVYTSDAIDFAKARPGHSALCRAGWSTPESIQRQRYSPELDDLREFLSENKLSVMVTAPHNSPAPSLLAAIGSKTNQKPFTYPEVVQLQDIAERMDNTLARLRLTLQARQSEQLATIGLIGASLAHEIRNPLVAIKTFAHLLPTRHGDEEFRRKFSRLIPEEVDRIVSLTQQLLDLANPRHHNLEPLALNAFAHESIELMQSRANDTKTIVTIQATASPDIILADRSSLRQVVINLFINAIQSLEQKADNRRIDIRTRTDRSGIIFEIADNGPGIPPEVRTRLFRPFASSKTKGMGLGLAVCADILREHGATIMVPDEYRDGALFRIIFPCPQSLS